MNINIPIEKAFEQALELKAQGRSIPEILDLFPQYRQEFQELFRIAELLQKEKESLAPPREMLERVLSRLPTHQGVTNEAETRSLYKERRWSDILQFLGSEPTRFAVPMVGVCAALLLVLFYPQLAGDLGMWYAGDRGKPQPTVTWNEATSREKLQAALESPLPTSSTSTQPQETDKSIPSGVDDEGEGDLQLTAPPAAEEALMNSPSPMATFAPLSEEEIRKIVQETIGELQTRSAAGIIDVETVMDEVKAKIPVNADDATLQKIVEEELTKMNQ